MNITTELVLRSPSLPLVSIAETLQPDEVDCVHALCLHSDVRTFTVQFDLDDDVSESELSALDDVTEATLLGETSDRTIYQLTVELEDSVSEAFTTEHIDSTQLRSATISKNRWHETKLFKDYEAVNDFRASCEDNDISLDLVSITPNPSLSDDSSQEGVTERQRGGALPRTLSWVLREPASSHGRRTRRGTRHLTARSVESSPPRRAPTSHRFVRDEGSLKRGF